MSLMGWSNYWIDHGVKNVMATLVEKKMVYSFQKLDQCSAS